MARGHFLSYLAVAVLLSSPASRAQQLACGRVPTSGRIINGDDADPGEWPWQVSFISGESHFCGGSLITAQSVLSAAHCFTDGDSNVTAILGRHRQNGMGVNEAARRAERIVIHPLYDNNTFDNDIAVVKLSAPVEMNDYISSVCLASAASTIHPATQTWVTGWGTTSDGSLADVLQEVRLPIVGQRECQCAYPELTVNMICAGFREGGKDSCQGDSGGPQVFHDRNANRMAQVGIVSFGHGCAVPGYPGVYTNVQRYEHWIRNVTGSDQPSFVNVTTPGNFSDDFFVCPTHSPFTTEYPPYTHYPPHFTTDDDSIFGAGENVIHFSHFSHFSSFFALFVSLYVLVGHS